MEVVRPFTEDEVEEIRYSRRSDTLVNGDPLADCQFFRVEKLTIKGERVLPDCARMRHVLCLEGSGAFVLDGERYPVSKGDSYFLPPLRGLAVEGDFMALVSSV